MTFKELLHREWIHVYVWMSPLLFTWNCDNIVKSAIPQYKTKDQKRKSPAEETGKVGVVAQSFQMREGDLQSLLLDCLARWVGGQRAWKVVGVVLGLWPRWPGRLVSWPPDSGFNPASYPPALSPSPGKKGRVRSHRPAPWKLLRGKITPADVLHHAPISPHSPTARECWVRAAYFGTQGTSNCRLQHRNCLLPVSANSIYFWVGPSGISLCGQAKRRHTPEPQDSLLSRCGSGGAVGLSVPRLSEFCSHQVAQASWPKRACLCVLWEALSDLVPTEKIVHWKETSRFFFLSFSKRCSVQECEVTVQWASRWWTIRHPYVYWYVPMSFISLCEDGETQETLCQIIIFHLISSCAWIQNWFLFLICPYTSFLHRFVFLNQKHHNLTSHISYLWWKPWWVLGEIVDMRNNWEFQVEWKETGQLVTYLTFLPRDFFPWRTVEK